MCTHMVVLCAHMHIIAQMGLYFVWFLLIYEKIPHHKIWGKASADEREERVKTANEGWNVPQSAVSGRKKIAVLAACESHPTDLLCCIFIVAVVL